MKLFVLFLKKIIVSTFLLYGYNLIATNFNLIIPINLFTIIFVTMLGIPSLIGLILFKIFILWGDYYGVNFFKKEILWHY